jgi:hypothetical protein
MDEIDQPLPNPTKPEDNSKFKKKKMTEIDQPLPDSAEPKQDSPNKTSDQKKIIFKKSFYWCDLLLFILLLIITIPILFWPYLITIVIKIENVDLSCSLPNSNQLF